MIKQSPKRPYLLFHPRFIAKQEDERWQYQVDERWLASGVFRGGCFAIDVDCREFPLLDVVNRGPVWAIWNVPGLRSFKTVNVDYIFSSPEQMTFDQARDVFVERVCENRWWTASHETEKQFRARNASYTNMRELIEPVSLKGDLP